jgi:hypothetical protein
LPENPFFGPGSELDNLEQVKKIIPVFEPEKKY